MVTEVTEVRDGLPRGAIWGVEGPRALPAHPSLLPQEELDLSCTFVCKAREKAGVRLPPPGSDRSPGTQNMEPSRKVPEKGSGDPVETPVPPQPVQARPPSPSTIEQSLALAGQCRDPQMGEGTALGALPASPQLRGAVLGRTVPPSVLISHPCVTSPGHGIEAAQMGQHTEAVWAFTVALELNPREHR